LIVGDDASTDNTDDVVREFDDPRIRYHRHASNVGIFGNWNKLVSMASGEYVSIYHDHDIYLPTIVEASCSILDNHPRVSVVHTAALLIDRNGVPIDVLVRDFDEITPGRKFQETMAVALGNPVIAASTMVRRGAYEATGPYDPEYGEAADKDMWLRLAGLGDVGYVRAPQALFLARGKQDATARFDWRNVVGSRRICEEWIDRLFAKGSAEHRKAERNLRRMSDRMMLRLALKAIGLEDPQTAIERSRVLRRNSSLATNAMIWTVVRIPPVRALVGRAALRTHLGSLNARRRAAEDYCRNNPHVGLHLPGTRSGHPAPAVGGGHGRDGQ
jgi:GT2 family glycosyltransferase